MKKTMRPGYLAILLALLSLAAGAWEPYDNVIAVVNSKPIVASEVEGHFNIIKGQKKITAKNRTFELSRVLDKFIEDALVEESAYEVSIIISDKRVVEHLEKMMRPLMARNVKSAEELDKLVSTLNGQIIAIIEAERELKKYPKIDERLAKFIAYIENSQKMPFPDFFEELRKQMRREQIMSIAIGASPPTTEEAKKWYKENKGKLGFEVKIKHILIRPRGNSITAEKEANDKLSAIRNKILKGESFEKMAIANSEDPGSASKGGDLDWVMLAELDPYFANNVFQMSRIGQVSPVFKSAFGYHIVKYFGRRAVTYEKVEPMIMNRIYGEKMLEQFKKWVVRRKKESEIIIYMDNYIKG
ncbi:MAG: hypothetical protein CVV44_11935 [Spirochaetae bacterium HGW-Spirochaetae-1]|jgi:putative peptidyl-prolyl cis-trans isomerase|nr:MAG: hypothetical protein CVV44_11935 [Spirochaetae bacterium HGW-Spirochaetae-1]